MKGVLQLAHVTFLDFVRQRVVLVIIFVAIFLTLLTLLLASLSLDERLRITTHIGFSSIQVTLIMLSLMLGGTVLRKELEKKTLYTILARPISRNWVYFSKWLGIVILISYFHFLLLFIHAILIRQDINWLRFYWAHSGLFFEVITMLNVSYGLAVFLKPSLAIVSSIMIWLGGFWQNELIFFAERSKMTLFVLMAWLSDYIFPKLVVHTELRSVYFLTYEMIASWGALGYLHQILAARFFI